MNAPATPNGDTATRLLAVAASGRADAYYRLARIVARVLVSVKLRQRAKWRSLAKSLATQPAVEERLVLQAIGWLRRGQSPPNSAA